MKIQNIHLDYPINSYPRYGYGKPPHHKLYKIIDRYRNQYKEYLIKILNFKEDLLAIPVKVDGSSTIPCWVNGWLPGLDSASLYSMLCLNNPRAYFEIGSGASTKFARRAIKHQNLRTKITSIDPFPRQEIDSICDRIIRQPLEEVNIELFDELESGDILFFDGSHRCFMNSDVTVFFLDILPELKKGVIVGIHDIRLPYDYPSEWIERCYSEQYLLATLLLFGSSKVEIILANAFISMDIELKHILNPLLNSPEMKEVERHGSIFWMMAKGQKD